MNTLKKWLKAVLCLACLCGILSVFSLTVYAKDARLVDEAGLLSSEEAAKVQEKLDQISEAHQMDLVILTVNSLGGKGVVAYADDYYDYHDYGYGTERDGLLLLISMADRDWAISTTGNAIRTFTDAGQEYLQKQFLPYLSDGKYEKAFLTFAEVSEDFMVQAEKGKAYDSNNMPKKPISGKDILISLVVGIVLAWLTVSGMKSKLKTVHSKSGAVDYIRDGSFLMSRQQDLFLYDKVTRVHKPKQQSGGGSSTHMSSSGSSHGGSHGKF